LGFDSDFLLKHSFQREIYAVPLAQNFKEFLQGKQRSLKYSDYPLDDLIGHWKKRNRAGMENYNPANLDREMFLELCDRYGGELVNGRLDSSEMRSLATFGIHAFTGASQEDPAAIDDFAQTGVTRPSDIPSLFVPNFYFGCEADDPINAMAFDGRKNPYGARLRAIFSSDIGHWDVPDMREVAEEAHELVDQGVITDQDFRDFVFANSVRLWTDMNPNFFKGTAVENQVEKLLRGFANSTPVNSDSIPK